MVYLKSIFALTIKKPLKRNIPLATKNEINFYFIFIQVIKVY